MDSLDTTPRSLKTAGRGATKDRSSGEKPPASKNSPDQALSTSKSALRPATRPHADLYASNVQHDTGATPPSPPASPASAGAATATRFMPADPANPRPRRARDRMPNRLLEVALPPPIPIVDSGGLTDETGFSELDKNMKRQDNLLQALKDELSRCQTENGTLRAYKEKLSREKDELQTNLALAVKKAGEDRNTITKLTGEIESLCEEKRDLNEDVEWLETQIKEWDRQAKEALGEWKKRYNDLYEQYRKSGKLVGKLNERFAGGIEDLESRVHVMT